MKAGANSPEQRPAPPGQAAAGEPGPAPARTPSRRPARRKMVGSFADLLTRFSEVAAYPAGLRRFACEVYHIALQITAEPGFPGATAAAHGLPPVPARAAGSSARAALLGWWGRFHAWRLALAPGARRRLEYATVVWRLTA